MAAVLMGGRATLRQRTTQQPAIATDRREPGVQCLSRAGEPVGVVAATPGTVELVRGTRVPELTCLRKGHLEERERIEVVNTSHVEAYELQLRKQAVQRAAAEQHANGAQGERPPRQLPLVGLTVLAIPIVVEAAASD